MFDRHFPSVFQIAWTTSRSVLANAFAALLERSRVLRAAAKLSRRTCVGASVGTLTSGFVGALVFACHLGLAFGAEAPRIQPVDVIEATPLEAFSEQTGNWPSERISSERIFSSGLSVFESADRVLGLNTRGSLSKGTPAFTLRGSVGAGRVLGLYDGVPLNLADGVGAQELLIPREAIQEMAILRGPSSVFYGSSAMSGGLNFLPALYTRPRLRATFGSFGQKGVFGALPVLANDNHKLRFTAFQESVDGDFPYHSLSTEGNGFRQRTDTHTQRFTSSGEHRWDHTQLVYRAVFAREFGSSPGSETYPIPTLSRKQGELYSIKAAHDLNDQWTVRGRTSVVQTSNASFTTSVPTERTTAARQSLLGLEATFRSRNEWKATVLAETKEDFYDTKSSSSVRKSVRSYEPGAVFETPMGNTISLQTGARYLPEYGEVIKALGARQIDGPREYFIGYSEGFRSPSLSDLFENDPTFVGNPALKPEKSLQLEVGLRQESQRHALRSWDRFAFAGSVYSISYEDLMVPYAVNSAVGSKRNEASATAFGADVQAGYPFRLLSIEAGYSYIDASARGRPVQYTTQQQYFVALAHYFGPLVMELRSTQVVNYQYGPGYPETFGWNTVDFTARTIGMNDYSFQAGLLNVLDQPRMYTKDYPEPQRRFFVSLERVF